jgi:DNA gyrase subunit B
MEDNDGLAAYDCGSIQVLEGLDAVRRRPGMYIGDTQDGSGLHHLAWEVIENALDQHLEDRCWHLTVTVHRHGALSIDDNGPGIPLDEAEAALTRLHGGSRLAYFTSGKAWNGLHGVGLAAVNALCEELVLEIRRGGRVYRTTYRRGRVVAPLACVGAATSTGTRITLRPDPQMLSSTEFVARDLLGRLRPLAFLHPALAVDFADERAGGRRERLHGRGLAAWVELLTEGMDGFPAKPLRLRGARRDVIVDAALRWTRRPEPRIRVFAGMREVRAENAVRALERALRRIDPAALGPHRVAEGLCAVVVLRGAGVGWCGDDLGKRSSAVLRGVLTSQLREAMACWPELRCALEARSQRAQ